jgi:hypothetical protein
MKRLTRFHIFWIAFWIIALFLLFLKDAGLDGAVRYKKSFSKNQFVITSLFPLGRTTVLERGQRVNEEPVYFSVYAPQKFSQARVTMIFDAPAPSGWSIGYQAGPGFQYVLTPLPEGVTEQEFTFNVSSAHYENNRLRFIVSNPKFSEGSSLAVRMYAVELLRGIPFSIREYAILWKESIRNAYANVF